MLYIGCLHEPLNTMIFSLKKLKDIFFFIIFVFMEVNLLTDMLF